MKRYLKLFLLALYILMAACSPKSDSEKSSGAPAPLDESPIPTGPSNGGGGDPRVAQFLNAADAACTWMQRQSDLNSKAEACRTEVADLSASVNDPNRVPRVYSDDQPALQDGVPKDAVTDLATRTVHINITRWQSESDFERTVTAMMEMTLLLAIPGRYLLGRRLTAELAASVAQGSPEQLRTFQEWAERYTRQSGNKNENNQPQVVVQGQTDDHVPCSLFITDKSGGAMKEFYLSLGVGPDIADGVLDENNRYIGGLVVYDHPDLQMGLHEINFRSINYEGIGLDADGRDIFSFSDRRLLIELSDSGQVFRVIGTSSLLRQSVVCNMQM